MERKNNVTLQTVKLTCKMIFHYQLEMQHLML